MKSRLPNGLTEFSLAESRQHEEIVGKLFEILKKEGFNKIEPSQIDYAKNLEMEPGSADFLFKSIDSDGKLLAFGGGITPSIVRMLDGETHIRRVYFDRPCYLFSPLQEGSRLTWECGAQVYGIKEPEGDAELITACYDSLVFSGIENIKITLSHSFLFKSIIYSYKPSQEITSKDIKDLIKTGKCDKLNDVCTNAIITLSKQKGDITVLQQVAEGINNKEAMDCLVRLFEIYQILAEYGLEDIIEFDFGYMPLESYYNGMSFKISADDKTLAEGGTFSGVKYTSVIAAVGFKYNLYNVMSILDTKQNQNDSNIILGVANTIRALNKARKIKLSLMESNVQVNTLYKVTAEECKEIAAQLNIENIIYVNEKGDLEE
ncbi:MAG: hypothetical protein GX242_00495 [Clostridiales bacterium]|nr:hypothetical protein [Clostridiales bacterium]